MHFPALDNLIQSLATLPGIGARSAARIAFHLLRSDPYQVRQLSESIRSVREQIRFCRDCGGLAQEELCSLCSDPEREQNVLCVVEEPGDIYAIEKTGEFRGLYHVLMGALSPLDGVGPEDLRIAELRERVAKGGLDELFIAANPTLEGDATARYLLDMFGGGKIRITRIAHGIPTGATIEYADGAALARSIRSRQNLEGV